MSESIPTTNNSISNSSLYKILKNCAELQSYESLQGPEEEYNDVWSVYDSFGYKMVSTNFCPPNGCASNSGYSNENSFGDNILEENGRISLAYENLRTIPRQIADKFAAQTKFLDLSYNNFQNLSFLTFFDDLHTLILDRNNRLDPNTLPYLPNLEILWINNCGILKIADWIYRIQRQCPALKYLSIMGNPGTNQMFSYPPLSGNMSQLPSTTNYRDYILNILNNLQYLDGIPRQQTSLQTDNINRKESCTSPLNNNSILNGNSVSDNQQVKTNRNPISPTLGFKEFFKLQRRKKSLLSSSTN